ncbi:hypothetical protein K402DRAFT_295395, partial [Aulographum hederae CBS 113979]
VYVEKGESNQMFHVYEDLIRSSSVIFDNALRPEWNESEERVVPLLDFDPETFDTYLKWLFTRKLYKFRADQDTSSTHLCGAEWLNKAYALGDYVQDDDFKDCVLDGM